VWTQVSKTWVSSLSGGNSNLVLSSCLRTTVTECHSLSCTLLFLGARPDSDQCHKLTQERSLGTVTCQNVCSVSSGASAISTADRTGKMHAPQTPPQKSFRKDQVQNPPGHPETRSLSFTLGPSCSGYPGEAKKEPPKRPDHLWEGPSLCDCAQGHWSPGHQAI
jgi:hypothetical protein